jgi:hypothetical protein
MHPIGWRLALKLAEYAQLIIFRPVAWKKVGTWKRNVSVCHRAASHCAGKCSLYIYSWNKGIFHRLQNCCNFSNSRYALIKYNKIAFLHANVRNPCCSLVKTSLWKSTGFIIFERLKHNSCIRVLAWVHVLHIWVRHGYIRLCIYTQLVCGWKKYLYTAIIQKRSVVLCEP